MNQDANYNIIRNVFQKVAKMNGTLTEIWDKLQSKEYYYV